MGLRFHCLRFPGDEGVGGSCWCNSTTASFAANRTLESLRAADDCFKRKSKRRRKTKGQKESHVTIEGVGNKPLNPHTHTHSHAQTQADTDTDTNTDTRTHAHAPEAAAFEDGGCGSHGRGADDHGARGAHQQSGASPQGTPPQREGAKSQQQQATGELFVQE